MVWYNPTTWFSPAPATPPAVSELPPPTPAYGARRRKTYRKRKGSKRVRTGRRSNRA